MTRAMAFSKAPLVMMSRGRMPARSRSMTASPLARAMSSRRLSGAAGEALPGSDMPRPSPTAAMVLAVNMPAQEPSLGQALRSMAANSSLLMAPTAWAPTASKTLTTSMARPRCVPGRIEPP